MWQRWQMQQSGGVTLHVLYAIEEPILAPVFLSWLSCLPPPLPPFLFLFFSFFSSPPLCMTLAGTWGCPLKGCSSPTSHTYTFAHAYSRTRLVSLWHLAAQRVALTCLSVCLSVSGQKRTRGRHHITPSAATLTPSTLALHSAHCANPPERDSTWWETTCQRWQEALGFIRKLYLWIFLSYDFVFKYLRVKSRLNRTDVFRFYPV